MEIFGFTGQKLKSDVWKYFGFYREKAGPAVKENLDMSRAVCLKSYANKGNTTNLLAHLNNAHSDETATDVDGKIKQKSKQMTLPMATAKPASIRKLPAEKIAELDDRLMRLIAGKVLPLSLVDTPFFRDFVGSLDPRYNIPGRKKIHGMLMDKKAKMTEKIHGMFMDKKAKMTENPWYVNG